MRKVENVYFFIYDLLFMTFVEQSYKQCVLLENPVKHSKVSEANTIVIIVRVIVTKINNITHSTSDLSER